MRNGHAALFSRVLELYMAAFLSHLNPTIPLKGRDNFPAFHGVYLYTLNGCAVNLIEARFQQRAPDAAQRAALAAWCTTDPGSILFGRGSRLCGAARDALHRVRDTRLSQRVIPGRAESANPESITTTGSMDSGPAPRSASPMCNRTSGNDGLCFNRRQKFLRLLTRRKTPKFAIIRIVLSRVW
jgi:hypothetical protein